MTNIGKAFEVTTLGMVLLGIGALSGCAKPHAKAETPATSDSAAVKLPMVSSPSKITKEMLLTGCEIPPRREFPIDAAINPCQDLYQYACHDVISGFHLRPDRSAHTFSFNDSYERILYAKKNYLRELAAMPAKDHFTRHQRALRNVYNACMDESASAAEEKQLVGQVIGAVNAIQTREQFMNTVAHRIDEPLGEAPLHSFVYLDTDPNQDDPFRRDAIFDSDLMTLPERSYYDNPAVLKDYEAVVTQFFKSVHFDNAAARAHALVEFEKDFADHYPLPVEFRDREAERNPITRAELLKNYPNLKLAAILKKVPAGTKFRNLEPETFTFLNEKLAGESLPILKDFLLFHSAEGFMDDAYPEFYQTKFNFNRKDLGGPEQRPDRQERCTRMVMSDYGRELDEQLLPILFPHFPTKKVVRLAETVRHSIIDGLKHNTWLSSQGRAAAINKLSKATLLLVKPMTEDQWDFTPKADYSPTERYANSILLSHNLIKKRIREYGQRRDRRRWLMGPLTINAYYMPMDNTFVLPQGILQYPFYDPNLPEKVNLAAAGSVIGHELGHSIDDKGAMYDAGGRLHQWMTAADLKEFKHRGGEFVERFNKLGFNGRLTLGENTADHVGLTFAFHAAFGNAPAHETAAQKAQRLADERAFFTQYARNWCQVMRPAYRQKLLKIDPHASGDARVNEQVRHQAGFQEAFSCKPGDGEFLPVEQRVRVW